MKKRTWIIIGIVVVLIAVGVVVVTNTQRNTASAQANVQLGRVTRATLSSTVDSSGSVTPAADATLTFGASGTVAKVNVQPGDHVKAGDVLAELDTSDLELQIAQQEQAYLIQQATYSTTVTPDPAAVTAAQIALNNASAAYKLAQQKYAVNSTDQVTLSCDNVDNAKQSYDDAVTAYNNYISNWRVIVDGTYQISSQKSRLDRAKAAYDVALANCNLAKSNVNDTSVKSAYVQLLQAKTNLDNLVSPSERTLTSAKAQLDQAYSSLQQAQQQLDNARIIAPFDGIVAQVSAVAGGPSDSGTIELIDASQYHVDVLVDETEIAPVKVGQNVDITFDALPSTTVTGTVNRIDPAGTISQGVVNYLVRVNLAPTKAVLLVNMSANTSIILATHTNVLAVPGTAIRQDAQGYYVNVVDANNEPQRVDVTTGFTNGTLTEVSGNLQPGEQVFIGEPPAAATRGRGLNLFGVRIGG
jgi:HlyD family secretion protein